MTLVHYMSLQDRTEEVSCSRPFGIPR